MDLKRLLIKNGKVVNEGSIQELDVYIEDGVIKKIGKSINISENNVKVIDAFGSYVIPGVIDDQVHFREPGLTHKADIESESKAAIAGGITSFIEIPESALSIKVSFFPLPNRKKILADS